MHVFNQNKQKIGTVYDILFDENFLYVNQIVVCKSLFFFRFNKQIFDFNSIIEVNKKRIIVNDDNILLKPLPSVV